MKRQIRVALFVSFALFGGCSAGSNGSGSSAESEPRENVKGGGSLNSDGTCTPVDPSQLPSPERWIDDFEYPGRQLSEMRWNFYTDGELSRTEDYQIAQDTEGESWEVSDPYASDSADAMPLRAHFVAMPEDLIFDAEHWGAKCKYETAGENGGVRPGSSRLSFDFSAYDGIIMFVRRGDPSAGSEFLLQFPTPESLEPLSGGDGSCIDPRDGSGTGANGTCYNHMAYRGVATDCWTAIKVVFAGARANVAPVRQPGPAFFDTKSVYGLEFTFPSTSRAEAAKYWPVDLWVDDIYLYKERK